MTTATDVTGWLLDGDPAMQETLYWLSVSQATGKGFGGFFSFLFSIFFLSFFKF